MVLSLNKIEVVLRLYKLHDPFLEDKYRFNREEMSIPRTMSPYNKKV